MIVINPVEATMIWLEGFIGTSVTLPKTAVEIIVDPHILSVEHSIGLCMPRNYVSHLITKVLAHSPHARSKNVTNSLCKLAKLSLSDNVNSSHIIALADTCGFLPSRLKTVIARSVRNHERMHATTMWRDYEWHRIADEALWAMSPSEWNVLSDAIVNTHPYSECIVSNNYDASVTSWIIVEEILGRLAAISHAPKDTRNRVAKHALSAAPASILKLQKEVEDRWGSVEALTGWLDAARWIDR